MATALKRVITPTDGKAAQSYVMRNNYRDWGRCVRVLA